MLSDQHPIGSGFGADTTVNEVLKGVDLSGKLVLITGGYSGLGLEAVKAMSKAGAEIIVPARRPEVAREALKDVANVRVETLDLGDLASVKALGDKIASEGRHLDIVINNAGIMAIPETRIGDGWEAQFATNHLGHYVLINRLWPVIGDGKGARVVALSSAGHQISGMRWDDVMWEKSYEKWAAYGQAKTANALFAVELDRLGAASGVRAFSVHPGGIMTDLPRHLPKQEMIDMGWIDEDGNLIAKGFKSVEAGAATEVWAATSPLLEGKGGVYCEDCDIAEVTEEKTMQGVMAYAADADEAKKLWTLSAELTGENVFAG